VFLMLPFVLTIVGMALVSRNARAPAALLVPFQKGGALMLDLILRGGNLPDGRNGIDIGVTDGRIAAVAPQLKGQAHKEIDVTGRLVSPPFVDSHFHLDAALTYGTPRVNQSGTLLEGIELWGELKPSLSVYAIHQRAIELCHWAIARGTLAIRSHVDVGDPRLMAVQALLAVKKQFAGLHRPPTGGVSPGRLPASASNRENPCRGHWTWGWRWSGAFPTTSAPCRRGCRVEYGPCAKLAAERSLMVDMHCDESDDPMSRHIETLAAETVRQGLGGRVTGSHLTSMHSMDNYYVSAS
jgi:cytosine deaminase